VGDLLIVSSCNGLIRALDKKTGQVRWSYDIRKDGEQTEFHGDPLVTEKLIIIGTDGKMGHLYAFEPLTGAVRWKYRVEWRGLASDIVRSGDNIYAVTLGDELVCLDLESGAPKWTFRSSAPPKLFFWTSSPAVAGDRVYFGGLDGIAYAVDARSGKLIWKSDLGARISTSIASQGGDIYVGTANRHLYRLDADSGKVLADFAVEGEPRWRLIVARDSLLVFLGPKTLASLDLSLKEIRWSAKASQDWMSSRPYVWRDTVLAGDGSELVALRANDGARAWSHQLTETIRGIGISDDTLYVGTRKGPVLALAYR
jgi:outer membrane protein assembly factor BamB